MGECRECRWWRLGDISFGMPEEWGQCTAVSAVAYTAGPADLVRGFVITADDATLETAPAFGCNQFAPRDAPERA